MKEMVITKQAIAQSFKELMKRKAFDKISISDITENCHLNRQTFYYHFQDKYELMNWVYYNEIFVPLVENLNETNFEFKFKQMFSKMLEEKDVYKNALSMSAEYGFKQYLFSILKKLVYIFMENKKSKDIEFYTFGLTGVIINWVDSGMKETPEELSLWMSELLLEFKRKF